MAQSLYPSLALHEDSHETAKLDEGNMGRRARLRKIMEDGAKMSKELEEFHTTNSRAE